MIFLKVNETKELAFENIDKIDNSQVRLTKEKRNKLPVSRMKWDIIQTLQTSKG